MNKQSIQLFTLIIMIIILGYLAVAYFFKTTKSGFDTLANPGIYPESDNVPLLTGDYPYSGSKVVSNDSYNDIWWHYPIFRLGSFTQITNNLRYYKNPDEGTCIGAEFCGALYNDRKNKTNIIKPLPPAANGPGPRVNYYTTNTNLLL